MAKRTAIGAIIKLDGESSFRASMQNCKNSISAMKSEIQTITRQYEGNANSLEALGKMHEQYAEIQKRAKEQEEKMLTAYEKSAKKQDDVKESMQKMKDAYAEAQRKLQQMQESGTATAESLEEQERATDEAYQAYLQYEAAVEKAEARTAYFQKALADAKTEELEAGEAVKKYSKYIEEANNSVDGTASSIDAYGREMKAAGEAAEAGGAGVSVFTGALGANVVTAGLERAVDVLKQGAEYAVRVGSEFEASQSKVQALSGATAAEMAQIEQMSKGLGRTTKFSASEISAGFSYMSLAGWQAQQQLAAMPGVVNLAIAAESDLASTSDMVTDYLTAFGLGAEHAGEMADMLAYAMSHSNADVTQFGEAWKNCAASMNSVNQSMQTTTALLESLANSGIKSAEAGTQLRAVTRDLTQKMSDGAITIGDTKIAIEDANGDFRDLIDILGEVAAATDGMGTAQRAAALSTVFTSDSLSAVNILLKDGMPAIRGYREELENCDGAASDMAATMNDNLSGSMKNLGSAVEGLGNAAYSYIGGPVRGVVDEVTSAINHITDAIEPQVTEIQAFAQTVQESIDSISKKISDADSNYSTGQADAEAVRAYLSIIEEARSKTKLTEFEVYQLNDAIKQLSGSVPELNQYVNKTGDLLGLSTADFDSLKKLVNEDYTQTLSDAVVARRNAYAQSLSDLEVAMRQEQSVIDSTTDDVQSAVSDILAPIGTYGDRFDDISYRIVGMKNLIDSMIANSEATKNLESVTDDWERTQSVIQEYIDTYPELREELNLTQDENGNWISSLNRVADETADVADSISDSTGEVGESSEDMADTVRAAVATYIEEMIKLENADPSDAIRDQLAAAAAEVQEFQNTIQSNLSSFSLFSDRSSLIDAYTNTNRDEMKLNMSWALSSMKNYTEELDTLQKRGMSSDFIEYLTSQGQAGLNYVHSLALASDAELQQFQSSFNEYQSYISGTNDSVKKLLTDYAQGISSGIADGYNSWHEFGIETTAGLFDAIDEATEAIKNGSISGDITEALQVILQNKADQINIQKETKKQVYAAQTDSARQTIGHAATDSSQNSDLRIGQNNIIVNVTTPDVTLDGRSITAHGQKTARARARITGRS